MGSLLPCALQDRPSTSKVWAALSEHGIHRAVVFCSFWRSGCHGLVLQPVQAGLPAEDSQNIENSGRSCPPCESHAQRLCDRAQFQVFGFGKGPHGGFSGIGGGPFYGTGYYGGGGLGLIIVILLVLLLLGRL